jgi:hypothetical protein
LTEVVSGAVVSTATAATITKAIFIIQVVLLLDSYEVSTRKDDGRFRRDEADGPTVFAHACKMGLEGIVSKRKDSAYRSGRSPDSAAAGALP